MSKYLSVNARMAAVHYLGEASYTLRTSGLSRVYVGEVTPEVFRAMCKFAVSWNVTIERIDGLHVVAYAR